MSTEWLLCLSHYYKKDMWIDFHFIYKHSARFDYVYRLTSKLFSMKSNQKEVNKQLDIIKFRFRVFTEWQ